MQAKRAEGKESKAVEDSVVASEQWQPKCPVVTPFPADCVELAVNVKTLMTNVSESKCCILVG